MGEKCDERKGAHLCLHPSNMRPPPTLAQAYPLHAIVVMTGVEGWEVEGRRGLSAGKGEIVLAVKLHLPHHLRLQTPVQMTAVLQALPPPSLGAVAVFTHPKPVSRTPGGEDTLCLVKAYTFFDVVVVCQK